jgi:hypothetical protein
VNPEMRPYNKGFPFNISKRTSLSGNPLFLKICLPWKVLPYWSKRILNVLLLNYLSSCKCGHLDLKAEKSEKDRRKIRVS